MENLEWFLFIQHNNQPIPTTCDIIKKTEKAIQIKTESGKSFWLPKSALEHVEDSVYTFKTWFKRKHDCPVIY